MNPGITPVTNMTSSRSIYAQKLHEFADFTFGDQLAFQHRGEWRRFFEERIGPRFDGRVILEIGCFDAAYLSRIAADHPHTAFVGLDWKCKALYDGGQRIAALGQGNIALLRARGQDLLKIFAPFEVNEIWVFHPDPCARDVELKNRLLAEPFLIDVHQVLADSASTLSIKTDHPGYYQWVLALLGLPEPLWFQTALHPAGTNPAPSPDAPRVRARDLMPREQIPSPSAAVCSIFNVTMNSSDYWHDPAALAYCAGECFSGELTVFESRFVKKRLPIYFMALQKKGR